MTTMAYPKTVANAQSKAKAGPRPFANPYVGGLLLGIVLFAAFYLTGNGLGASGALNRLIVWIIAEVAPQQVGRVSYLVEYAGGDKNALDHWIVLLTAGIFVGGLLSGWFNHRIRFETIHGPRITPRQRWLLAFAGGILSGYGARLARGCTSSQGLSGAATLSVGSWAFLLAFFAGGYLLAYALRRLWT
jgi:uncharacterized membrane protein YedE/YeeE